MEDKNNMENGYGYGSINPSELATLSLLGGGYGGYGIGVGRGGGGGYGGGGLYTGNNVLAAEAHANGTAVNANVNKNAELIKSQGENFENLLRDRQFSDLQMEILNGHSRLSREIGDNRTEAIRIAGDNRVELANRLADMAAKNAECCCETQKLVIAENGKTRELIKDNAIRSAERELDACRSKNNSSEITVAIGTAIANQTNVLAGIIQNSCKCHHEYGRRGGRGGRDVEVD